MAKDELQNYTLTGFLGITFSELKTVKVEANTTETGIALGQGECKAVRIRLNAFTRNSNAVAIVPEYFYYGDSQSQEFELETGVNSELIPCTNLNQIWVRNPYNVDIS